MNVDEKLETFENKLEILTTQNVKILSFMKNFTLSALSIKQDATYISEELNQLKKKHTENVDVIIKTMLRLSDKADKISGGLETFEKFLMNQPQS